MKIIQGAGGGGGGGGGTNAPNTLRADVSLKVIDGLCEGEIAGIMGGAKGIYFDWTPLQATDNSYNWPRLAWESRKGTPTQDIIAGYPAASSPVAINTPVTNATPVIRTSPSSADRAIVTLVTTQGMLEVENGNRKGSSVTYVIETKLSSSGTWANAVTYTMEGKTTSAYERSHSVPRPAGTGAWDIRVSRTTPDATTDDIRNEIAWSRRTDQTDITEDYGDTAVSAITVDAEALGGKLPLRAWLIKGAIVKIPNNLSQTIGVNGESVRTYTGTWDGTFTTCWTDCPFWCLYDLVTNFRYGGGEFIPESAVDKWSFYDASVYSRFPVDDGKGGTEPRFSLNCYINNRDEAQKWFSTLAGVGRANLVWDNGLLTVVQDRPSDSVKLLSEADVIDGKFTYSGTAKDNRHTAYNVTWFDRADRHFQKVVTLDMYTAAEYAPEYVPMLTAETARYGYVPADIAAFGATSQGQAIRQALWALDTELTQTDAVGFSMGLNGFNLRPGDIVDIYQNKYTNLTGAGRIKSVVGTTVTLDRPVVLGGENELSVLLDDGETIESRAVIGGSGAVVTIASGFSQAVPEGRSWHLITTVQPRRFKIISIRQQNQHEVALEALFHDPGKYARVEEGIFLPPPVYTNPTGSLIGPPVGPLFEEVARPVATQVYRSILVSWGPPLEGIAAYYHLEYRRDGGTWEATGPINALSIQADNVQPGVYDVRIFAHSLQGTVSAPAEGTYEVAVGGEGESDLLPPTNLVNALTGSTTTFLGNEIPLKFTNPVGQADVLTATLYDFEYKIIDPDTDDVLETGYTPAIEAGATSETLVYTLAHNMAHGGPRRSVKFEVRSRDANFKTSAPLVGTFTNAAPAVPANITHTAIPNGLVLSYDPVIDPDLAGYGLYWSYTSPVVLDATNLILLGTATSTTFADFAPSTNVYYHVFAYDTFNTEADIAGALNVNLSTQQVVETDAYSVAAPTLSLQSTGFAFVYENENATTSDSPTITFDAILANVSGTVTWTVTAYNAAHASLGTLTLGGSGNTGRTLTAANFNSLGATTTRYVKVTATLGSLSDTTTVYRGDGGSSVIQAALSNEAHTLAADSAGTVGTYAGSGTEIRVYQGIDALVYDGVGTATGTWGFTSTGATAITRGTLTDSGNYVTVGNHSAMTADQAFIVYNIAGKDLQGVPFTLSKQQTLSKSRAGATGATGATGGTGATGQRGSQDFYVGGRTSWSDAVATAAVGTPILRDTVTQYDDSGAASFAQTRWWNGSSWALPGTVIDGSVLVTQSVTAPKMNVVQLSALTANMGQITAGNYDGSGYLRAQGNVSLTVGYFGGAATRTAAIVANTSLGAQVGVYGRSTGTGNFGVLGVNATGFSGGSYGVGVYGEGGIGLQGFALNAGSIGINGVMNGSVGAQTAGLFNTNGNGQVGSIGVSIDMSNMSQRAMSTQYGRIEFNGDGSNMEVRLKASPRTGTTGYGFIENVSTTAYTMGITASGNAEGSASIVPFSMALATGNITITRPLTSSLATGTAPFTVSSTTVNTNLNADMVDGFHASSFQTALGFTPVRQGTGTSQLANTLHFGWSGSSQLRVQVDSTDFGTFWPINVSGSAASATTASSIVNPNITSATITTGGGTATFPGNNKPGGSTTCTWVAFNINGSTYWIPAWT
jgi:predicted phage tail protein